jgi:predicted dehydrogenase
MKAKNSSLVAVMRRNEALAEDYARRHGVPRWSGEAEDILQAPDIDAIYVATPPSSHREYVCRAAEHGKAVLVEKRMGLTHSECSEMIATCQREGVSFGVAYCRRCLPRYVAVRNMIASGAIGKVRGVNVLKCQQESRSGNGSWRLDAGNFGHGVFIDTSANSSTFSTGCSGRSRRSVERRWSRGSRQLPWRPVTPWRRRSALSRASSEAAFGRYLPTGRSIALPSPARMDH